MDFRPGFALEAGPYIFERLGAVFWLEVVVVAQLAGDGVDQRLVDIFGAGFSRPGGQHLLYTTQHSAVVELALGFEIKNFPQFVEGRLHPLILSGLGESASQ